MDRISSIELAMKNERTEMEFYRNESKRSKNPLAKAMFDNLANDEKEHMQRIAGLHKRLIQDGSWPQDMPIEVQGTDIKKTLESMVANKSSAQDHDDDDIKALKKAIEFESNGAQFYSDLATQCDNPMEKGFFQFLARIEREHYLSLTDSVAYLDDPEGWNFAQERGGLDGA